MTNASDTETTWRSVRLASSATDAGDWRFLTLVHAETHKEGIKSPVSYHRNGAKLIALRRTRKKDPNVNAAE
jgi:hypothetical protein